MNQRKSDALNAGMDGDIKLEFHGAKVIPLSGNGVSPILIRRRPDAADSPPFSNRPGRHGGRPLPVPVRKISVIYDRNPFKKERDTGYR
ncbi:hypothetical protein ACFL4Q_03630 [candidate division KSB1 bacterium]